MNLSVPCYHRIHPQRCIDIQHLDQFQSGFINLRGAAIVDLHSEVCRSALHSSVNVNPFVHFKH